MALRVRREDFELVEEYRGAQFGDERLDRRLIRVAELLGHHPEASLPAATGNDADLEATYRFLNNEAVAPGEILRPHVNRTVERCRQAKRVVVAHDTTEFNFGSSRRADLGRVGRGQSYGFYGHFALAVDAGEARRPLGVLGFEIHSRNGDKGRRGHSALQTDPANESRRWLNLVERARQALGDCESIHVMDREADSYALMADLVDRQVRFVIRMAGAKRQLDGEEATVGDALREAAVIAEREVPLTARGRSKLPSYRKHYPERRARMARLSVSACRVTLTRPDSSNKSTHKTLTLNVVRVVEPDPPSDEPPVEWRLWTTEPVDTATQVLAVVDAYRCRWRIEEYFKALKSGCAVESRQLETHDALVKALAIYAPVAWRLLMLRALSQLEPDAPATNLLSPVQLRCLAAALNKLRRADLPNRPTVRDAMLGVAGLGGHIKNNGDPGWIVLGRGLDTLLTIELGYRLAAEQM